MNLLSLTAVELGKKIKAHEVTVEEATRAALDAIRAKEKDINSFVTVDEESAMIRAKEVQKMIDDGTLTGPLAGLSGTVCSEYYGATFPAKRCPLCDYL